MGGQTQKFYESQVWRDTKTRVMLERGMVCEHCGKLILSRHDSVLHHKTELTELNIDDFAVSLAPENLMLVHFKCHNKLHGRFSGSAAREVYIVHGSPRSGKTTWVRGNAEPHSIVVDVDSIWDAICTGGSEAKPDAAKSTMFRVRDLLLDEIRTRGGRWGSAYIIGGYPSAAERTKMAGEYGAKLVHIDTPKDICLGRAGAKGEEYVMDYWRKYTE
ncbi:MAG: HNH endonuclease [Clostridiales Family XIII bacterium]|jgi:predicted kinase|nr:HNH endonuclease [Clostridiales Family XIII bacterium]